MVRSLTIDGVLTPIDSSDKRALCLVVGSDIGTLKIMTVYDFGELYEALETDTRPLTESEKKEHLGHLVVVRNLKAGKT